MQNLIKIYMSPFQNILHTGTNVIIYSITKKKKHRSLESLN